MNAKHFLNVLESYILTPKHDESTPSKDLNEYIKIHREKECEFQKEFRVWWHLFKWICFKNIKNSLIPISIDNHV